MFRYAIILSLSWSRFFTASPTVLPTLRPISSNRFESSCVLITFFCHHHRLEKQRSFKLWIALPLRVNAHKLPVKAHLGPCRIFHLHLSHIQMKV